MNLANHIDHTLLKQDATVKQINQLITEAKKYDFASVCINPYWVKYCADALKNTNVKICTVIGFPLGATSTAAKVAESKEALKDGADELDMVINIGELKANNDIAVKKDIHAVAEVCHQHGKILKVIIETCLLTDNQKIKACHLSEEAGADFVKTSTGFSTGGANVHDVKLMRQSVSSKVKVKAAGGIHTQQDALDMINAGADRIGASASVKIMNS